MANEKEQRTLARIGAAMANKCLTSTQKMETIINAIKIEYDDKQLNAVPSFEKEYINQLPEAIPLYKGDIVKTQIGPCPHYSIVHKIDKDYNTAFVIPLTSDETIELALPIQNSRIFKNTFYLPYFAPVFLAKNQYKFIGVFDNLKELENIIKNIKMYYKNFLLKNETKTKIFNQ